MTNICIDYFVTFEIWRDGRGQGVIMRILPAWVLSGLFTFLSKIKATLVVYFAGYIYFRILFSVWVIDLMAWIDSCVNCWAGGSFWKVFIGTLWGPILGLDQLRDWTNFRIGPTLRFRPRLAIPSYLLGLSSSNCPLELGYFGGQFGWRPD